MKTYSIEVMRVLRRGEAFALGLKWDADCFTSLNYKTHLISSLFDLACMGCDYNHLTAYVKCNGETILIARSDTVVDGSTITAYITAARPAEKFRPVRAMVIGE